MMAKYSAFWEHSKQVNDIKKIALSKAVFDGFLADSRATEKERSGL